MAASTTSATFQFHPSVIFSRLRSPRLLLLHRRFLSSSATTTQIHSYTAKSTRRRSTWIAGWSEPTSSSFPKRPAESFDYRKGLSSDDDDFGTSRASGSSTMASIVEKLKKYGYIDESEAVKERLLPEKGSVEDVFYAEDGILPDTRGGLSLDLSEKARFPWERKSVEESEEGMGRDAARKRNKTSLAELTLPAGELRRLRHLAIRIKSKMKIGGAGVTRDIVDLIHEKWRTDEVVRLKCEGPPALNMKRMHEILERKTGGLVIWRSGTSVSLYRGVAYEDLQLEKKKQYQSMSRNEDSFNMSLPNHSIDLRENVNSSYMRGQYHDQANLVDQQKDEELPRPVNYEVEIDKLLNDLGPRYIDWPGGDPLPVDADLLPGTVAGYKPPFRILPYGVRKSLGLKEGTTLRRLARALPPHFALGRSRQHEGLAAAIVKLWEKSSIVKIALKRGVQLTSSERMAEDIKKLTGGTMLSRSKDYIVFYRGKDFLAPEVTEALLERERIAKSMQDEEEQARLRASVSVGPYSVQIEQPGIAGSLGETLEANAKWGSTLGNDQIEKIKRDAEIAKHADLVRKLERKLSLAERKLLKASKALAKVEDSLKPAENIKDPQTISDEERFMFRKLGLRMKAFLLLGRRGVFDGTVENMHLHWKYRELVKIIVKVKTFDQVKNIALSLEAESGGILVSVDKISKGFAIIVYRGKDYSRPPILRPRNLLTKRKALARSIELQRRQALSRHMSILQKNVEQLKYELNQMENIKDKGDEELYTRLDAAYSTESEDSGDEEDEESYFNALSKADKNLDVGEGDGNEDEEDDFKDKFYSSMNSDNDLDIEEGDESGDDDNFDEYDDDEIESGQEEEDDFKESIHPRIQQIIS